MGSEGRMASLAAPILALGLLSSTSASPLLPAHHLQLAPSPPAAGCPDHCAAVDMGCLLFNSSLAHTWEGANLYCQSIPNSRLLEISTEMQMAFVRTEAQLLVGDDGPWSWWTAATDIGLDRLWIWAASLDIVGDFVWAPGKPDYNKDNNCMMLQCNVDCLGTNYMCSQDTVVYPICQMK